MGTIVARPRKDGTVGYTAQIKIKREGRFVFSQAQTFDREAAAKAWIKRKEAELAKPGALDAARKPKGTLSDTIDKYLSLSRKDIGKTKAQVLDTIKGHDLAAMAVARELEINIPDDLVLVGFDGIEEAERSYPSLTTIAQHSDEKGRTAARILLSGELGADLLMPSELIIRQSC